MRDAREHGLAVPRLNSGAIPYESGKVDESGTWRPAVADPSKNQVVLPDFDTHPIPEVARMLYALARVAGIAPPWRLRVSGYLCQKYTIARLQQACGDHAIILTTLDGNSPAPMITPGQDIEFSAVDNPGAHTTPGAKLWVPD